MDLGVVILPEQRWRDAEGLWRRAEELGFTHAWTYDHLAWRSLRDSSWFGALPVLTAAAAVTDHLRIGPLVASPNYRHPVPFAKELMTLDDICGGRLTVGIGSGGTGWDATVLGEPTWSPIERADRFAEFVQLTDRLLRESTVSFTGRYYSADGARMIPGCVQQPRIPLAVAGAGRRAIRVAVAYGEFWVTTGEPARGPTAAADGPDVVRALMDIVDDECESVGRDPATLRRLVLTGPLLDPGLGSATQFRDTVAAYEALGVSDVVVHWPRTADPYAGHRARFEEIVGDVLGG